MCNVCNNLEDKKYNVYINCGCCGDICFCIHKELQLLLTKLKRKKTILDNKCEILGLSKWPLKQVERG